MNVALSALEKFLSLHRDGTASLFETAETLHAAVTMLREEIQNDYDTLCAQHARATALAEEAAGRVRFYTESCDTAETELARCSAQMDYIATHPVEIVETDESGNITVHSEIDRAALRTAQNARDLAHKKSVQDAESLADASILRDTAEATVSRLSTLKQAVYSILGSIENDLYEMKKYKETVLDEAKYNLYAIGCVIERVREYLASKALPSPQTAKNNFT